MATKPKKASNIVSGKNARIIPAPKRSHHKKVDKNINEGFYIKVKATMSDVPFSIGKPATILYKKLPDDMILITGFENFLSAEEIYDKYGKVITDTYSKYPYHMRSDMAGIVLTGITTLAQTVATGTLYSKDSFSKIIAHVKKCGGLLHDIIQACDKGEVKRIEI